MSQSPRIVSAQAWPSDLDALDELAQQHGVSRARLLRVLIIEACRSLDVGRVRELLDADELFRRRVDGRRREPPDR